MHIRIHPAIFASALLITTLPLAAQKPASPNTPQFHPYTAEFNLIFSRELADGTTITRHSTEMLARDSQGRTKRETVSFAPATDQPIYTSGAVNDPVDGRQITWDSNRIANVLQLPPPDQRKGCWADDAGNNRFNFGGVPLNPPLALAGLPPDPYIITRAFVNGREIQPPPGSPPRPTESRQQLGTQTIMGVEAKGYRLSTTMPAGIVGNDRPLVSTSESWMADGFDFAFRKIDYDPQTGTHTRELVNLNLGEPDLSAFQPPDGYKVKTTELHRAPCR